MEIRPILSAMLRAKTAPLLIAAQVAITLAIICNTTYLINERLKSAARPSGVDEANSFVISYANAQKIDDIENMQRVDVDTLRGLPGVVSAAWTNQMPMGRSGWNTGGLSAEADNANSRVNAAIYMSGDSLVDSFDLRLLEGRDFLPGEFVVNDPNRESARPTQVIVTKAVAEQVFPGESSVVGKQLYSGPGDPQEIVGVVERLQSPWASSDFNAAENSLINPVRYLGETQAYIVRTEPGQLAMVMREAEKALSALRQDRVLRFNRSMEEVRDRRYAGERLLAGLLLGVTGFLLLITASGIVGMASLWVNQRRKQIGVRRALGARRFDILRYFLVENAMIGTLGIIAGLVLALLLNDVLVRELSIARLPVHYLAVTAVVMWLLGLAAVLAPAMRAARVSPATATRSA